MSSAVDPFERRWRSVSVGWRAPLRAAWVDAGVGGESRVATDGGDVGGEPASSAGRGPRELQLLSLRDRADGAVGYGEVADLPGYLGVSVAQAHAAALDIAALDLRARQAGIPLWQGLGGSRPVAIACNATIGADSPALAADQAATAVRAGFRTVKVKVGDPDDLARVAAARAAVGPDVALRIDANGVWDRDQAVARLSELARFDLELCEEPVHGARELIAVAAALPELLIAADESAAELLEELAAPAPESAPTASKSELPPPKSGPSSNLALCLKVARGGITPLLADAARGRELGLQVYLASTLDGPLGIAAALHAAAVVTPDRACGLATLDRFERPVPAALEPRDGRLPPPAGAGLGDGLLDWYR